MIKIISAWRLALIPSDKGRSGSGSLIPQLNSKQRAYSDRSVTCGVCKACYSKCCMNNTDRDTATSWTPGWTSVEEARIAQMANFTFLENVIVDSSSLHAWSTSKVRHWCEQNSTSECTGENCSASIKPPDTCRTEGEWQWCLTQLFQSPLPSTIWKLPELRCLRLSCFR